MESERAGGAAVRNAVFLGGMCFVAYLACYVQRNILGAVSPQLLEENIFTTERIGALSSVFSITYAVGQLINGIVGDRVKGKIMIFIGLISAGAASLMFPLFIRNYTVVYFTYAATGFFLSMIYAPMTRLIAENTRPDLTPRCSLGYTFASFLGSPAAGLLASFTAWRTSFNLSAMLLVIMGVVSFFAFTWMERRGIISYRSKAAEKRQRQPVKVLFRRHIVKVTAIVALTGVIRTSVVFWLPTYLSQYLGFSGGSSGLLFSAITLVGSFASLTAVFLFERVFRRRMMPTAFAMFIVSAAGFMLAFAVRQPAVNITGITIGIFAGSGTSSVIWSCYCPSLYDTGLVSSVTGFLDFVSYMVASAASSAFAGAVGGIGWSGLILVWAALMAAGALITLPVFGHRGKTA